MAQETRSVTVAENGHGRYQQSVVAGSHRFIADEPLSMGGADAAPAPYDYLLAALGACTSMTLRMYAERKELPLAGVSVVLAHRKVEVDGQRIDLISRDITLDGDLNDAQRERMLEIANRCPVARTLAGSVEIESRLTSPHPTVAV